VIVQEAHDRTLIAVHVQDHATHQSYRVLVPEGLVPYDVAELLISEIRHHRSQAGVEAWRRSLPGPWLLV
jgi:hypothetical protein